VRSYRYRLRDTTGDFLGTVEHPRAEDEQRQERSLGRSSPGLASSRP